MSQENNQNKESKESKSKTLDLENLNTNYKNLLIEYKLAVSNYIDYLNNSFEEPCNSFTKDSKNIDQKCYDEIWKQAGCTTSTPNSDSDQAKSKTLNDLIYDSFLFATDTSNDKRVGCYGDNYQSAKLNTLTEPNYTINKSKMNKQPEMVSIKGLAYWGTKGLSENISESLEECKASCAKTPGCSGATFNPDNQKCFLRTGDGQLVAGESNDYAIVPKGEQLLKIIKNINSKLVQVNEKIQTINNTVGEKYNSQISNQVTINDELNKQYKELKKERIKIKRMLDEYQSLDEQQTEGNLHISQNYYSFILLSLLVILFVFILYKFSTPITTTNIQSGGKLSNNVYYIVLGIVLLIFITTLFHMTSLFHKNNSFSISKLYKKYLMV